MPYFIASQHPIFLNDCFWNGKSVEAGKLMDRKKAIYEQTVASISHTEDPSLI